jgi:hypothetical protein
MIGDFKQRLRRLEQRREQEGDTCPECHFKAGDIREIVISLHPAFCPDWQPPPLPPRPPEELCGKCGRPKTIRTTELWPPEEMVLKEPDDRFRNVPLLMADGRE